jgi:hypothetical protein
VALVASQGEHHLSVHAQECPVYSSPFFWSKMDLKLPVIRGFLLFLCKALQIPSLGEVLSDGNTQECAGSCRGKTPIFLR